MHLVDNLLSGCAYPLPFHLFPEDGKMAATELAKAIKNLIILLVVDSVPEYP